MRSVVSDMPPYWCRRARLAVREQRFESAGWSSCWVGSGGCETRLHRLGIMLSLVL